MHIIKGIIAILTVLLVTFNIIPKYNFGFGTSLVLHAQEPQVIVYLNQIKSDTYPEVIVYVTVVDEEGKPILGLTEEDFVVLDDGVAISPDLLRVEPAASPKLKMVLVMDNSMPAEPLEVGKISVSNFIDYLRTDDEMAMLILSDGLRHAQQFTSDKTTLKNIIDSLQPEGNFTTLNEAIIESANVIKPLSGVQRAVLIVTNTRDNVGRNTDEEALAAINDVHVPYYIVGVGLRTQGKADTLQQIATSSGGQFAPLNTVSGIEGTLVDLADLLQQGYKITYESPTITNSTGRDSTPDILEKKVVVQIISPNTQQIAGQDSRSFTPTVRNVHVNLPGFENDIVVGGNVHFTPEIISDLSINSVRYLVDENQIEHVLKSPFDYQWDSTMVDPGPHALQVIAIDKAGNTGKFDIRLKIVPPMQVTISSPQKQVIIGKELLVDARIEALVKLENVELLINGEPVGSDSRPPYEFSLDTSNYQAGLQKLSVRATDILNRIGQDTLSIEFIEPPVLLSQPTRVRNLWTSLKTTAIWFAVWGLIWALALFMLLLFLVGRRSKDVSASCHMEIHNQGNVASRFELWADDPLKALKFIFTLKGIPLELQRQPVYSGIAPSGHRATPDMIQYSAEAPPLHHPVDVGREGVTESQPQGERKGCGERIAQVSAFARMASVLAEILMAIGYFLPTSIGTPVRKTAMSMRRMYSSMRRVEQVQKRVGREMEQFQGSNESNDDSTGQASVSDSNKTSPAIVQTDIQTHTTQQVQGHTKPSYLPRVPDTPPHGLQAGPDGAIGDTIEQNWTWTPHIDSGERLAVRLLVKPIKAPWLSKKYDFRITSTSVEKEDAPLIFEEAQITIPGLLKFQFYLSHMIIFTFFFLVLMACATLAMGIQVFG
ncbi:MAG: hypothetical protein B6242_06130 [Anaerolineaceae bacterium 4572_78]|nr:MAG: hypothetical protein B6242_06130 [Anaerolineaceae bacterium 4572_78]